MNLDLPSFDEVAQSRKQRAYSGYHAKEGRPEGLKPHVDITSHDLKQGATVTGCETCIMLRNVLLMAHGDVFQNDGMISCMATSRNTLRMKATLKEPMIDLELYARTG